MHALIVLECSAEEIFFRIRNNMGGDRTGRSDDSVELIEKKIKYSGRGQRLLFAIMKKRVPVSIVSACPGP